MDDVLPKGHLVFSPLTTKHAFINLSTAFISDLFNMISRLSLVYI